MSGMVSWISTAPESGGGKSAGYSTCTVALPLSPVGKGSFQLWQTKLKERKVSTMKNLTAVVGLMMVSAAPLMAASRQAVTYNVVYENLTPQQTMERDVQRDLALIANPGNGGKMHDVQLAKANAMKALANDQAALEAYKTAGPKMAIPRLEQAVRDDQFAIEHWGTGGKLASMLQARDSATLKLAQDQASLDALRSE